MAPYLGPPSESTVVKMIPNERLPPRNLHKVHVDKSQATLKWQPPYDSPGTPLVIHTNNQHELYTAGVFVFNSNVCVGVCVDVRRARPRRGPEDGA